MKSSSILKLLALALVLLMACVHHATALDQDDTYEASSFVRADNHGRADSHRLGRFMPRNNKRKLNSKGYYSDNNHDFEKCGGDDCLSISQRRAFFDEFWFQSYNGEDRRTLENKHEQPRSRRDLRESFNPVCSEFRAFKQYVCPCEEYACDSTFGSYDYCDEYLGLGDRFGDDLGVTTGEIIDILRGCVGYVEECCHYPRHCCGESCLNKRALCNLYTNSCSDGEPTPAPIIPPVISPTPAPIGGPSGPSRHLDAAADESQYTLDDLHDEQQDERNLFLGCDCSILWVFGKDLCPREGKCGEEPNPWDPLNWEEEESFPVMDFCDRVAPGCEYCQAFVLDCCESYSPPFYNLPGFVRYE